MNENEFNSTKHWSDLCVRLLQGPLFEDDNKEIFEALRLWNKEVNSYFNIIGLKLFYSDEIDYAYLQQIEDEDGNVIDNLNRLLKRRNILSSIDPSFDISLISISILLLYRDSLKSKAIIKKPCILLKISDTIEIVI